MNDRPGPTPPPGYGPPPGSHGSPGHGPSGYPTSGYPTPGYPTPGHPAPGGHPGQGYGPTGYGPPPPPQPTDGVVPLRPLGVGDVLRGALATARLNPVTTVLLPVGVMVGVALVQLLLPYLLGARPGTEGVVGFSVVSGASSVLSLLATAVLGGMITVVVSRAVLGQPCGVGAAWAGVRERIGAVVGLNLLILVILFVLFLVAAIPLVVAIGTSAVAGTPNGPAIGFGVLLLVVAVVVALWISVTIAFATAAVVLEGLGVGAAMKRSRALVRGSWWRTFGILALVSVIVSIPTTLLFGSVGGLRTPSVTVAPALGEQILPTVVGGVVTAVLLIAWALVATLLYLDQRIRRERLDLTLAGPRTNY